MGAKLDRVGVERCGAFRATEDALGGERQARCSLSIDQSTATLPSTLH